jgi:hypothetical protein
MDASRPYYFPPSQFLLKRHRCIRRARGWKGNRRNPRNFREPVVEAAGRAAVQRYEPDGRVCLDKSCNIVGYRMPDPAVGAPFPRAAPDNVPESDPLLSEAQGAFRIGKGCRDREEFLHNPPEAVLFVPVVFAAFKRQDTGKTAKNEDEGVRAGHRRESAGGIRYLRGGTGHAGKIRYP